MKTLRSLLPATLVAALSFPPAPAAAQKPVTLPTPAEIPCPQTGGLKVGQPRAEAFKMMARKEVTNEVTLMHAPEGRPYRVDVTFASASPTAEVVKLHYVFNPPSGLLEGILDRYGKPTEMVEQHATGTWEIASCKVTLRYKMQETADHKPLQEEMWIEPLSPRREGQVPSGKPATPEPKKKVS